MSIGPIDYASRDFKSILEDMRRNMRTALPDVNDFFESNAGRYILDQQSGVGDMIGYTIDRYMLECFISTVETRPSLVDLVRLIGFQPQNPTPERVLAKLSRGSNTEETLVLGRYTPVLADNGVPWVTELPVTFDVDQSTATVGLLQGRWLPLTYVSNGAPYQMVPLSSLSIAEGMIRVFVQDVEWTLADDNTFVGHSDEDTVFRINNMADKRVRIEFGNGGEGFIPPRGANIRIESFVTLGPGGHIDRNRLVSVEYAGANLIPSNDQPSSGGNDYESIASAKRRYPVLFRAMRRAVTRDDWEALAESVPGVMRAKAVDLNIDPKLPFYKVRLHVIGHGGLVSDALNIAVRDFLRNRRVLAALFEVVSPTQVVVDVAASIYVKRTHSPEIVQADVVTAVRDFFTMGPDDTSEIKLGVNVPTSRLISNMQNVDGVAYLSNLTAPAGSLITIQPNEFPVLRNVTITVAGTV